MRTGIFACFYIGNPLHSEFAFYSDSLVRLLLRVLALLRSCIAGLLLLPAPLCGLSTGAKGSMVEDGERGTGGELITAVSWLDLNVKTQNEKTRFRA